MIDVQPNAGGWTIVQFCWGAGNRGHRFSKTTGTEEVLNKPGEAFITEKAMVTLSYVFQNVNPTKI